jgi:proteasome lid subunit RPN8/RPN11
MNQPTQPLPPQQQSEIKRPKAVQRVPRDYAPPPDPVLRFSPTAWAKLLFFRDMGESEIGGFGIAAADNLLRIEEFCTVKQEATVASIAFDDLAVADFFEAQVDAGRKPEQFGRIWLHTHPGNSAQPSATDDETFWRVFGRCQWAVMFILARSGHSYARLRFNIGPGGEAELPVKVDYSRSFGPSAFEAWEAEYRVNVKIDPGFVELDRRVKSLDEDPWDRQAFIDEWLEDMEAMEYSERGFVSDKPLVQQPPLESESEANHEREPIAKPV